ncbi:MAG: RNA-binding transcriptional accessory protein [Clostridia bacterium]|nr:RNA-binding transcriptional accessory protein [Clostridia bacterium]
MEITKESTNKHASVLAAEFNLQLWQAEKLIELIDEGNTIPFIARYRKEAHGSLDDQTIRKIFERLEYLRNLDARKAEVLSLIEAQGALTEAIAKDIEKAATMSEVEDIYRPFKPKRKTRASVAKEKGLEPLALKILEQDSGADPYELAKTFINEEKDVKTEEEALKGASDIIAEVIADDAGIRRRLRVVTNANALLTSKAAKEEDSVYSMYYDFSQPVSKIQGHRVLAVNRGEKEGFLKVSVELDEKRGSNIPISTYVKNGSLCGEMVREAAVDAYNRLIYPAIEREVRNELTDKSCESAIKVFKTNLRELLMQPPVKGRVTIGLDPGYRTGCKVAVVDATGKVLDTSVIYVTHGENQKRNAETTLKNLIRKHGVTLIAIGNGTASKETEIFTDELLRKEHINAEYVVVSEAGASVYSASKLAAEEYPEYDLTLRSAVSIAHRLQDALSELVKIDPKAIGVGQYQHDMPQKELGSALEGVVEDCVNTVGVDLNTASPSLLKNVAGVTPVIAKNILAYREENGEFKSRTELKKVPKLGPKAFEQCAGFLRIPESDNILDNTAVHPESYSAASKLLTLAGYNLKKIPEGGFKELKERIEAYGTEKAALEIGIGVPTLNDIVTELMRPGRDPRDEIEKVMLRSDIKDMKDLKPGMELMGTVRNVIDFGAFIDIGVHQDGLVHITEISHKFVKHPGDVLKVGEIVKVWVLKVDESKKRISLTMKAPKEESKQ